MKISVVVPLFNESQTLPELYSRISVAVCEIDNKIDKDYEIIFVNDCSQDNTLSLIKDLAEKDNHIRYLSFSRNFGHQIAVCAGVDIAKGTVIVIIDGDLQDPPELIPQLYRKHLEGYNVVYAKRVLRNGESYFKIATAKLFYRLLANMTSIPIPLDVGDFRLIDQKVLTQLKKMDERQKFLRGQIAWIGFKQIAIHYERDCRKFGKTGYTLQKMFRFAMDGLTSFSDIPLKLATLLGLFTSFLSCFILFYALFSKYVLHRVIDGWTSLIITIVFIGGVQLFCIGVMGEYISRIYLDVRKRPLYIIDESNLTECIE
jgi:dolichol-phosphate mannosyltransferase